MLVPGLWWLHSLTCARAFQRAPEDLCAGRAGVKSHPLDPLTHAEIKAAAGAMRAAAAEKGLHHLRFNVIALAVRTGAPYLRTLRILHQGLHACWSMQWRAVKVMHACTLPAHRMECCGACGCTRGCLSTPAFCSMQEPAKADLIAYEQNPDNVPERAAFVILQACRCLCHCAPLVLQPLP